MKKKGKNRALSSYSWTDPPPNPISIQEIISQTLMTQCLFMQQGGKETFKHNKNEKGKD